MSKPVNEFQKNAAECERMARVAPNEEERCLWRALADKWERMTPPNSAVDYTDFDRLEAQVGTGQEIPDTAH